MAHANGDNSVAVLVQPSSLHSPHLPFDVLYVLMNYVIRQDLLFPNVPRIIQAWKGVHSQAIYEHAINAYLKNVREGYLSNKNAHNFPSNSRSRSKSARLREMISTGHFLGVSTANVVLERLIVSLKGIPRNAMSANLRSYMSTGQGYKLKLTEDFAKLLAPLKTLTIRRERWTQQTKSYQFCCLLNIVMVEFTQLTELNIVYDWITDDQDMPLSTHKDTDKSFIKFRYTVNKLLGRRAVKLESRVVECIGTNKRWEQKFQWKARPGKVLEARKLTEKEMKESLGSFMQMRYSERPPSL